MTERIQELIEKASKDFPFTVRAYVPELFLAKFAELIVRECVEIAYEYDAPKMSGPGMIIAGRIEQHFGVE